MGRLKSCKSKKEKWIQEWQIKLQGRIEQGRNRRPQTKEQKVLAGNHFGALRDHNDDVDELEVVKQQTKKI